MSDLQENVPAHSLPLFYHSFLIHLTLPLVNSSFFRNFENLTCWTEIPVQALGSAVYLTSIP